MDDDPVDEMNTVAEYLEDRVAHMTRSMAGGPDFTSEDIDRRDQLRRAASTLREEIALSPLRN